MELESSGIIENNPLFLDQYTWDFAYQNGSPCIDAGDPASVDPDGSRIDIGARWYGDELAESGDCNADGVQNVLDVVYLINDCILVNSNNCNSCGDLNLDGTVNILDVIMLVNSVLGS